MPAIFNGRHLIYTDLKSRIIYLALEVLMGLD
jgi:hypothetical protein